MYWLLFTIIWITIKLFKFRIPSNKDDSKWTFGQILPLILLVAPLVVAIEAFYRAPESQTPLAIAMDDRRVDHYDSNLDDVADLGHVDTLAYRGVFFLAALSYMEIGIYFVLDQQETEGLVVPILQISFSVILLQPMLQIYWVVCDLWLSRKGWNTALKFAIDDTLFLGLSAISLSANFIPSSTSWYGASSQQLTTAGKVQNLILVPFILLLFSFNYLVLVKFFEYMPKLRDTKWRFTILLPLPCCMLLSVIGTLGLSLLPGSGLEFTEGPYVLAYTVALMFFGLFVYGLEVRMEKDNLSSRATWCFRFGLLLCTTPACLLLSLFLLHVSVFLWAGAFVLSCQMWALIGVIFYLGKHLLDTALVRQALYWRNLRWVDIGVPLPYSAPAYPPPQT